MQFNETILKRKSTRAFLNKPVEAEKIQQILGSNNVTLHNIATTPLKYTTQYQHLIFGIPTWDYGELQEDWDSRWDELDELDLQGKHFAPLLWPDGNAVGYGMSEQVMRRIVIRCVYSLCGEVAVAGISFQQAASRQVAAYAVGDSVR